MEWIKTTERLPDDLQIVFVVWTEDDEINVEVAAYKADAQCFVIWWNDYMIASDKAACWLPMPKIPAECV